MDQLSKSVLHAICDFFPFLEGKTTFEKKKDNGNQFFQIKTDLKWDFLFQWYKLAASCGPNTWVAMNHFLISN